MTEETNATEVVNEEIHPETPENIKESTETSEDAESSTETAESKELVDTRDDYTEKQKLAQKRINVLTGEKFRYKNEAEQLKQQTEMLIAEIAALKANPSAERGTNTPEIDQMVNTRAEQIANEKLQNEKLSTSLDKIWNDGVKEYGNFDESVSRLGQLGKSFQATLPVIAQLHDAHKIIEHLSNDLDAAARLMEMTPEVRAIELARLENTIANKKTPPVPVSKAPNPIKPIDGVGKAKPSLEDGALSTAEWMRQREKELQTRGRR